MKKKLGGFLLGNGRPATLTSDEIMKIRERECESEIIDYMFQAGQFIHIPNTAMIAITWMAILEINLK